MNQSHAQLLEQLQAYKRRYYLDRLIRGSLFLMVSLVLLFSVLAFIEYKWYAPTWLRAGFFFSFLICFGYCLFVWVLLPVLRIFRLGNPISNEDAAIQIGMLFPEISDKLLNTLQLSAQKDDQNALLAASIAQKSARLLQVPFKEAIQLKENARLLPWALPVLISFTVLYVWKPEIFTESTRRIVKYQEHFEPPAPFQFLWQNQKEHFFEGENVTIDVGLKGEMFPEQVYLQTEGRKLKMDRIDAQHYRYTFQQPDKAIAFQFTGAGYNSKPYEIEKYQKPQLKGITIQANYPSYLKLNNETFEDQGNVQVPAGTQLNWEVQTQSTSKASIWFDSDAQWTSILPQKSQQYSFQKKILKNTKYKLQLSNKHSNTAEGLEYQVVVVADEFPAIQVEQYTDSSVQQYTIFAGNITDDHGITDLALLYRTKKAGKLGAFTKVLIPFNRGMSSQRYMYQWNLEKLSIDPGETLEYFLAVWDNDQVQGPKSARTQTFYLYVPDKKAQEQQIDQVSSVAQQSLSESVKESEQLRKELKKIEQKLRAKQNFDWQDQKTLQDLVKKHENLQQKVEDIQKKNEELMKKQAKLQPNDEKIAEKAKQLQTFIEQILDEETKKLLQELSKLVQEKNKENEIKQALDQLQQKDQNIEKELDKALEMFKQLKLEQKLEQNIEKLSELSEKQEKLAEKSEDRTLTESEKEKLESEQEKINEAFQDLKKEIEEMHELNKELDQQKALEKTNEQEKEIEKSQQESKDALAKKDMKKASKEQKQAAKKMKEMQQKMAEMQDNSQKEALEENIESLRAILENLIQLSFGQEQVMKDFRKVSQQDPRFVQLSQQQLKLKDDSKIIEDSLYALAKRAMQIQGIVTKELNKMDQYMKEATDAIKQRRPDIATGKQQFAMTSMNNLALMLDEALRNMQDEKASSMPAGAMCNSKKKNKKGNKGPAMKLSDMQKKLNQQMEEIKRGGSSGKKLSQELGKLAKQQEQIRNALQSLEKEGNLPGNKPGESGEKGGGTKNLQEIKQEMERTENELVNKRLTEELIQRQQDILSRLLQHENAQRERELDEERKAEQAKQMPKSMPPSLKNYLKAKEKQIELLRTITPNLKPYYKQKANEYLQSIE